MSLPPTPASTLGADFTSCQTSIDAAAKAAADQIAAAAQVANDQDTLTSSASALAAANAASAAAVNQMIADGQAYLASIAPVTLPAVEVQAPTT